MTPAETVSHALSYPFPRPATSFLFPSLAALTASEERAILSSARRFVLVIGSNAAPARLAAKFGRASAPLPVLAVRVSGLDVAHASFVAAYGSVAATVLPCAGATLRTHATMLAGAAFDDMLATEKGYYLARLRAAHAVELASGAKVAPGREVLVFVWRGGALQAQDGRPRAQGVIPAEGRRWQVWTQRQAVEYVKRVAGLAEETVDEFVLRNVQDAERREAINRVLRERCGGIGEEGIGEGLEILRLL